MFNYGEGCIDETPFDFQMDLVSLAKVPVFSKHGLERLHSSRVTSASNGKPPKISGTK